MYLRKQLRKSRSGYRPTLLCVCIFVIICWQHPCSSLRQSAGAWRCGLAFTRTWRWGGEWFMSITMWRGWCSGWWSVCWTVTLGVELCVLSRMLGVEFIVWGNEAPNEAVKGDGAWLETEPGPGENVKTDGFVSRLVNDNLDGRFYTTSHHFSERYRRPMMQQMHLTPRLSLPPS